MPILFVLLYLIYKVIQSAQWLSITAPKAALKNMARYDLGSTRFASYILESLWGEICYINLSLHILDQFDAVCTVHHIAMCI